jgi:hypothetical protein
MLTFLLCVGRKRSQAFDRTTILIQHPSRHQLVRGVLDVEVLYLLLNSSLPKERYVKFCYTSNSNLVSFI